MKKLNIGSGNDIMQNCINLDRVKKEGVDVIHELNKFPYPFPDNHFDVIYAYHIIEHLDSVDIVLKELYRILKKEGLLYIRVPHFSNASAYDPYHKGYYNINNLAKGLISIVTEIST